MLSDTILPEPLAPWRSSLSRAIHRNRSQVHSRYFQLATVTPEGKPANRTVVFRGFVDRTNLIQIITDSRSEKIEDLRHQSVVEICWYFTQTREQFRLSGNMTIVGSQEKDPLDLKQRQLIWQNLSDAAREQFAWDYPKQPRDLTKNNLIVTEVSATEPPDNFYLLLFEVDRVDFLELRGNPQNRRLYTLDRDNNWLETEVNP